MAEARVFPAIDINASGTRKEERLFGPDEGRRVALLRRALADRSPKEAMETLLARLGKFETNEDFLESIPLGS
jgi:transcription termination factor Rho